MQAFFDDNDDSFMQSMCAPPPPPNFDEDIDVGDRTAYITNAAETALACSVPPNPAYHPNHSYIDTMNPSSNSNQEFHVGQPETSEELKNVQELLNYGQDSVVENAYINYNSQGNNEEEISQRESPRYGNVAQLPNMPEKSHGVGTFVRTRDNVDELKRATKKPFLKKGSRKEPSSLHRFQYSPQTEDLFEDKNSGKLNKKHQQLKRDKLERLEQMQRQHIDLLQQKLEKRKNNMPKKDKLIQRKSTYATTPTKSDIITTNKNNYASNQHTVQPIHVHGSSCTEAKKSETGDHNTTARTEQLPETSSQLLEAKKAYALQMKSMKKRQEVALMEAEQTRESTKAWAKAETEKMKAWVAEQRAVIQRERHKAFNASLLKNITNMDQKKAEKPIFQKKEGMISRSTKYSKIVQENEALKATLHKIKLKRDESEKMLKIKNKDLLVELQDHRTQIQELEEYVELLRKQIETQTKLSAFDMEVALKKKQKQGSKHSILTNDSFCTKNNHEGQNKIHESSQRDSGEKENSTQFKNLSNSYSEGLSEEPTEFWLQRHLASLGLNTSQPENSQGGIEKNSQIDTEGNSKSNNIKIMEASRVDEIIPNQFKPYSRSLQRKEYDASKYGKIAHGDDKPQLENNAMHSGQNQSYLSQTSHGSRTEYTTKDGHRIISFQNGTEKEIFPDGKIIVRYANGDVKTALAKEGKVIYFYSSTKTTHTTLEDGLQIYEFPNQQTEYHYPDGKREIVFQDSSRKIIHVDT